MRVVFWGTPAYAVPTLDALVGSGHEVALVVAQPDRPSGRGQQLQAPPVAARARELGLPLAQPKALRSGPFPARFQSVGAEVSVVVAYGRILPGGLLETPRWGSLNGHGSLLPRWRGAAPIQRALLAGDTVTGVTVMRMDEGLDTGPMLLERALPIGPDETAGELSLRLSQLTAALLVQALSHVSDLVPRAQDATAATLAPPLTREDGLLDWTRPAQALHNQVRALQPWPGTVAGLRGEPFKLRRARPVEGAGLPGEIIEAGDRLCIACGEGALEVLEAQLPNRKPLGARDLINGARLRVGERLGPGGPGLGGAV